MDTIFEWCVELLVIIAAFFEVTYEEINVIIFVIGYPILLAILLIHSIYYKRKYNKLKDDFTKN